MNEKKNTEENRIQELMEIAQKTHEFGSIGRHLPPEVIARKRVKSVLENKDEKPADEKLLNKTYGIPLPWQESIPDEILNTTYWLPFKY